MYYIVIGCLFHIYIYAKQLYYDNVHIAVSLNIIDMPD